MKDQLSLAIFLSMTLMYTSSWMSAQSHFSIDLTDKPNETITKPATANQDLTFTVLNKLPGQFYDVIIERNIIEIPPLSLNSVEINILDTRPAVKDLCLPLYTKLKKVMDCKEEEDLPELLTELTNEINSLESSLAEECMATIKLANKAIKCSQQNLGPYKLNKGEYLEITVIRKDDPGNHTWKSTYKTTPRGKWLTSYGFSFISQWFAKEKLFFLEPVANEFIITPDQESNMVKLAFAPSIFFTWMPYEGELRDLNVSAAAGLGYDLESPTVFLGVALIYNQNISFVAGLTAHNQSRLNSVYHPGQKLKEIITPDLLHKKSYVVNPFISLTFKLGETPFKSTTASNATSGD
ncbi:MAG: hypothetical protein ABIQ02_05675 [Saprospiraceae bacterium]